MIRDPYTNKIDYIILTIIAVIAITIIIFVVNLYPAFRGNMTYEEKMRISPQRAIAEIQLEILEELRIQNELKRRELEKGDLENPPLNPRR